MNKRRLFGLLAALALVLTLVVINNAVPTAKAAGETWTVTYHTNGGDPIAPEKVADGDYAKLPTPVRDGYVFCGWFTDTNLTKYYGGSAVHKDFDLYAKWNVLVTEINAKVVLPFPEAHPVLSAEMTANTHCTNQSGIAIDEMDSSGRVKASLTEDDLYVACQMHRILVWFTPEAGYDISRTQTKAYINGFPAYWWTSIGDGKHTCGYYIMYATPDRGIPCELTFYGNDPAYGGAASIPGPISGYYGEVVTLPDFEPICPGYTFEGWAASKYDPAVVYKPGGKYQLTDSHNSLYAIWKPVPPTISNQPADKKVSTGTTAKFTVSVKGFEPFTYQWQAYNPNTEKWVNSGSATATTPELSIKAQIGHNGFKFRCIVTDRRGVSNTSEAATLTVVDPPVIQIQPTNTKCEVGRTATFNTLGYNKKAPTAVTYQWQAYNPRTGKWVNSGASSANDQTLIIVAQAGHNDFKFRCIITNSEGISVTTKEAILTVIPAITKQPSSSTVSVGATAKFTVTAKGAGTLTYQWQTYNATTSKWVDCSAPSAKTETFSFKAQKGHNGKKFRCIVIDGNGNSNTTSTVTLKVK